MQLKLTLGSAPSSEIEKVARMLEAAACGERRDLSASFLRLILRDALGEQQKPESVIAFIASDQI